MKSPLSAKEKPLQAEMLYPTVRSSDKMNWEDWTLNYTYHPGIQITGIRVTGVRSNEGPLYLGTTK